MISLLGRTSPNPIERGERGFVQSVSVPRKSIGDHDDLVSELGGVTSRRLAADVRHGTRDQDCVDTERVELRLQIALAWKKRAGAGLDRQQVAFSSVELVPDSCSWSIRLPVVEILRCQVDSKNGNEVLGHRRHTRQHPCHDAAAVSHRARHIVDDRSHAFTLVVAFDRRHVEINHDERCSGALDILEGVQRPRRATTF